ncbi:MAG: response regulator transcription factor [Cyanobacteria bacterium J06623_7]
MSTIDVLIADDQNFVRQTLERYLESESDLNIVGFAENGRVAIEKVSQLKPDVVLMDIEMPIMDGLTATKTIAQKYAATKVLILSIHDRQQDIARAFKLGAKGYWLKNTTAQGLTDAIRYVHKGYFQLALELVNKHFDLSTIIHPQIERELELSQKLKMVDTVLAQVEQKIDRLGQMTPQTLNATVESIVKQEMSLRRERDAELQFQFERLRFQLTKLKQQTNSAITILTLCNILLFLALIILGYIILSK